MASSSSSKKEIRRGIAVFMAFGTKGDVYPIAAICAGFARDRSDYEVVFVTHSAHQDLAADLMTENVGCALVSSPPVLSPIEDEDAKGSSATPFSMKKKIIAKDHRCECISLMEKIFGEGPTLGRDFIVINFFALEGWNLAELFHIRCAVAAPYVVPYSVPSSFERRFRQELPLLYRYLKDAPVGKVCWNDITHWMWPLFMEEWGSWRSNELNLSRWPFTDPVTGLPFWHDRPPSPLLLYGFSREVVECPDYWPLNARVCGFWHLPPKWQFSCNSCKGNFDQWQSIDGEVCSMHTVLQSFLSCSRAESMPPIFICLSSIGRMGFLKNSLAFLCVLQAVLEASTYRFILLSSGYEPLERAIRNIAVKQKHPSDKQEIYGDCIVLFSGRLLCFSGSVPYIWLFPRCAAAVHHGGSGSTAAALQAGIPQVICPFILDQFYWAERMSWIGVAPEPLKRHYLLPEQSDEISIREGASELSSALSYALSSEVRTRAQQISERITHEDGVSEAARILKEEIACHDTHEE